MPGARRRLALEAPERTATQVALGLLAVLAIAVGGYALMPSIEEQSAMLRRGGDIDRALALLRTVYDGGDRRPRIARQIAELESKSGHLDAAIATLGSSLDGDPADAATLDQRARLLLAAQRPDAAVADLARAQELQPTAQRYGLLLAAYRATARADLERDLVFRERSAPYVAPADLSRGAQLLAAAGLRDAAVAVMAEFERRAPTAEIAGRLLHCEILLDAGRSGEAAALAAKWASEWTEPSAVLALAQRFAVDGHAPDVAAILDTARRRLPEIDAAAAGVMTASGNPVVVRRILDRWAHLLANSPNGSARHFVGASIAAGDPGMAIDLFRRLPSDGAAAVRKAEFAEVLVEQLGLPVMGGLVQTLPFETLVARPLFGARVAQQAGNALLARRILEAAKLDQLSSDERKAWLAALRQLKPDAETFADLYRMWLDKRLPEELLAPLSELAIAGGQFDAHAALVGGAATRAAAR